MKTKLMSEEKLISEAAKALVKKLGPVETSRFLSLPHKKRLESVKRHRIWQAQVEKNAFFDKVFSA